MSDREHDDMFGGLRPRMPYLEKVARSEPPPAATEPYETKVGSGEYKSFGFLPAGFGETCDVRRWIDGTDTPEGIEFQYRFLMQIGYVGETELRLFLPDCIVVIQGAGLSALRRKLARRQVTFIQQHSGRIWPNPPAGDTIIECIAVMRPEQLGGQNRPL